MDQPLKIATKFRDAILKTADENSGGMPPSLLSRAVRIPQPMSEEDVSFFYGSGGLSYSDIGLAVAKLSELLQTDGIQLTSRLATKADYERWLNETKLMDLTEHRFVFLALKCGFENPPHTVMSYPPLAPVVLTIRFSGAAEDVNPSIQLIVPPLR